MRLSILALCVLAVLPNAWSLEVKSVVCYYNSKGFHRTGQAKFVFSDLRDALPSCTHLVYGYAGINPENHQIVSLDPTLDLSAGQMNYNQFANLKRQYPALKLLLSVGGGVDPNKEVYSTLLEHSESIEAFVKSAQKFIKDHGFDGLDLAWQFPETKPKRHRGAITGFFHKIKTAIHKSPIDDKAEEHKEGFTALVRSAKRQLTIDRHLLTVSVLPNVNHSIYFDVPQIIANVDQVHLWNFDYATASRDGEEADYAAPLYAPPDRNPENNGDYAVKYWLNNRAPANKLIYGIPTHARTFKMTSSSAVSGVPPLEVDGPGAEGVYTKEPGLLSYAEVCTKMQQGKHGADYLRQINDPKQRYGSYAFRTPGSTDGLWASYEDPLVVTQKCSYVKKFSLGGVAIIDVTLDDFKGLCTSQSYPLLKAARMSL